MGKIWKTSTTEERNRNSDFKEFVQKSSYKGNFSLQLVDCLIGEVSKWFLKALSFALITQNI